MEQKHNVFFSYTHGFESSVANIAEFLERKNITCWYAPRNLDNGADYNNSVDSAIDSTDIVVVLLCDEALQSDWVKREITQAEDNRKVIIPFVMSELTIYNGLRMRLMDKHWIFAYPDIEKHFDVLEQDIRAALDQSHHLKSNFKADNTREKIQSIRQKCHFHEEESRNR